jgi:hypothetical protein
MKSLQTKQDVLLYQVKKVNDVGTYAALNPEFEGIKRLNFFRYFEEINTLA